MMARTVCTYGVMTLLLACAWGQSAEDGKPAGAMPGLAFVCETYPFTESAREAKAALAAAQEVADAAPVVAGDGGTFRGVDGKPVELNKWSVAWYHQGDVSDPEGPVYSAKTIKALKEYVASGHGLFLSGAALGMIDQLGAESAHPRRGGPGNDRSPAGLVPVVDGHPIFRGLKLDGRVVQISNTGYPAFSDFHGTGGPFGGMLLARSPGGGENPVAEYEIGKGRVIVMGWRLPHYAYSANPHRGNLVRLTANIVGYLADPKAWQKVEIKPRKRPEPPKPKGIGDEDFVALQLAIEDLVATFGGDYADGDRFLRELGAVRDEWSREGNSAERVAELTETFGSLRREALLANPLMQFEKLMVVKRRPNRMGLPRNWQSNSCLPKTGYDNEIATLSPVTPSGDLTPVFRPAKGEFVGDVDLHFDADRVLFSMPGANGRWQLHELALGEDTPGELPLITESDVDNYDACYLPDGNVIFTSTAPFVGVPCVKGSSHVANLFRFERDTGKVRQLTFDQDHDWCPTVLNNGRVLYLRWEYSDIPHFVSRILFHMNPDGTEQMEYYGSNSYWPNAMFYARPIPGSSSQFVAVVGGHHDNPRMGELVVFDTNLGRHEATGAVQRIPGRGKAVDPIILDGLTSRSWPKYLHPWPLGEHGTNRGAGRYFLVSAQPTAQSAWGIYLVDVFDNMVLVREEPGYALLEPVPVLPTAKPPVIPSKVEEERKDAVVFMADVYAGPGLRGVPRGTVKELRLLSYHFAYHGMGGQVNRVGLDGPWDVKRIVGTVPVGADGSACFRIPANTPIAVQPLDEEGKALQLMRSWMTAMPGEVLSCVGCHERQSTVVPSKSALAAMKQPDEITPWYGPSRGFSFVHEVQPVLDRHCIRCHNGSERDDGLAIPDFRDLPPVNPQAKNKSYNNGTTFTPAYMALRAYVRSPTIESDMHLLPPGEFHADTTLLVRLLRNGHHGVQLGEPSWERLITWIDLHTPAHGRWTDIVGSKAVDHQRDRRREMLRRYAGRDEDPEEIAESEYPPEPAPGARPSAAASKDIVARSSTAVNPASRDILLAPGVALRLVRIGTNADGEGDDLWIGAFEVTNEQFAVFDPQHDSRLEHGDFLQFGVRERGYPVNASTQPVCRVSWNTAMEFCRWLSGRIGERVMLPTEAEWERACRAGTTTPLWFGTADADFARFANLADASLQSMDTFGWGLPSGAVPPWRPAIAAINDGHRVSAPIGSFEANAWGLHDMHGNVAEWTRSAFESVDDEEPARDARMVVRGGSWYDRPAYAQADSRRACRRYLPVFDVGFRVVSYGAER